MKLTCSFLFLLNGNVEIIQCIIEIVELIMKQSTEEIQTRLLLLFAAAFDCYIQKPFCLPDFVQFLAVVYVQLVEWEWIASDYTYDVQAECIFVSLKTKRCLAKVLACHQVLLRIHFQNSSTQPFIVDRRLVQACATDSLRLSQVVKSMFVLLYSNIPIWSVGINVEDKEIVLLLVEFARTNLICLLTIQSALSYRVCFILAHQKLRFWLSNIISILFVHLGLLLLLLVWFTYLFNLFLPINQYLQQIRKNLYTLLDLALHQVHDSFSEVSV